MELFTASDIEQALSLQGKDPQEIKFVIEAVREVAELRLKGVLAEIDHEEGQIEE